LWLRSRSCRLVRPEKRSSSNLSNLQYFMLTFRTWPRPELTNSNASNLLKSFLSKITAWMSSPERGNLVMFFSTQSRVYLPSSHLHWQGEGQVEVTTSNTDRRSKK